MIEMCNIGLEQVKTVNYYADLLFVIIILLLLL